MILLVDDDSNILEACQLILETHGFHVIACTTGEQALEIFLQHQDEINIVVTDYQMPNMNGLELIQRIRMHQSSINTILISGDFNEPLPNNISFFKKPFSIQLLVDKIQSFSLPHLR